jgi:hypothetical protein
LIAKVFKPLRDFGILHNGHVATSTPLWNMVPKGTGFLGFYVSLGKTPVMVVLGTHMAIVLSKSRVIVLINWTRLALNF